MKQFLIVIIFLSIALHLQAQSIYKEQHTRVALGYYFYGSGDIFYPKIELEYRHGLAKRIDLGAVINFGYTNTRFLNKFPSGNDDVYVANTIIHFDLLAYLKAIDKHQFVLSLFLGPSYFYDHEFNKSMDEIYSLNNDIFGLTAGFETNYKLSESLALGIRGGLSGVKEGAIGWGGSIHLIKSWK